MSGTHSSNALRDLSVPPALSRAGSNTSSNSSVDVEELYGPGNLEEFLLNSYEEFPSEIQPRETIITLSEPIVSVPEADISPFKTFLVSDPAPTTGTSSLPKVPVIHVKQEQAAKECILELEDVKNYYGPNAVSNLEKRHMLGLEVGLTLQDVHPAPLEFLQKIKSHYDREDPSGEKFNTFLRDHWGFSGSLDSYLAELTQRIHANIHSHPMPANKKISRCVTFLAWLSQISCSAYISLLFSRWFSLSSLTALQATDIYRIITNSPFTQTLPQIGGQTGFAFFHTACTELFSNATIHTSLLSKMAKTEAIPLIYFDINEVSPGLFNFNFNPFIGLVPLGSFTLLALIYLAGLKISGLDFQANPLTIPKKLAWNAVAVACSLAYSMVFFAMKPLTPMVQTAASMLACQSTFTPTNSSLPRQTYGLQNYGSLINTTNIGLVITATLTVTTTCFSLLISHALNNFGRSTSTQILNPPMQTPQQTNEQTLGNTATAIYQPGMANAHGSLGRYLPPVVGAAGGALS